MYVWQWWHVSTYIRLRRTYIGNARTEDVKPSTSATFHVEVIRARMFAGGSALLAYRTIIFRLCCIVGRGYVWIIAILFLRLLFLDWVFVIVGLCPMFPRRDRSDGLIYVVVCWGFELCWWNVLLGMQVFWNGYLLYMCLVLLVNLFSIFCDV